jgi:cytoskeletal protein RodZ
MTEFPQDPNDQTQINRPVSRNDETLVNTPPPPPPDPNSETQMHIPEIKREPDGLPWLGIGVIGLLLIAGIGLLVFALVYGQGESENRSINGTVIAALSQTVTQGPTRAVTSTQVPTLTTVPPTDTAAPTETPVAETATPETTSTVAVAATNTRPPATSAPVVVQPTAVPPTNTPVPPQTGTHGITGSLTLCNPEKSSFATNIERICFYEKIVNTTSNSVYYGKLGVSIVNVDTGAATFHNSWTDVTIGPGCTGPSGTCGGPWEDGTYLPNPGTYRLALSICYSAVDACVGGTGEWETFPSNITVTAVNWTPQP